MNPTISSRSTTPQLGFDFASGLALSAGINKSGSKSITDIDLTNPTGIAAGEALSRMIVDDRVLHMGMTTWRALLDRAISLGHTELYPSEDGQVGLRTPGLRFGPIQRMPELGPQYVIQSIFKNRLDARLKAGEQVKSGRVLVQGTTKVDLVVLTETMTLCLYLGRKHVGALELDLDTLTAGCMNDGESQTAASLASKLAMAFPDEDNLLITQSAQVAFGQVLKALGIGGLK
ncbi:hypothetical protein PVE_R2G0274 [Pseudomonas veronii 1YdBTEX2]|uniref:Uncharacterized protein n=1 Tax=Pseudomonas veronii 1YdBTEX2 TaxID=1295141 RepID=A0A1D3K7I8_PSEVE|nr:hypothetical protein PVE_R2G0274 [Pseudomonas veronii 1YdBTEX2]